MSAAVLSGGSLTVMVVDDQGLVYKEPYVARAIPTSAMMVGTRIRLPCHRTQLP